MVRLVLVVELGANTPHIDSAPCNSLATNRALIPSFLRSRSQRVGTRFFPRATCRSTVWYTPQTLRVGRVLSAWPSSLLETPFSGLLVIVEVLCRAVILSSRYHDCSHLHTSNVHLRAFAWRMLCVWRHFQCRGFGCSLGRCSRPELSESPSATVDVGTTRTFASIAVC